jgi:hypothetical protein
MVDDTLFWTLVLFLLIFNLWQRRIRGAGVLDREAAEALRCWMNDHPDAPLSWPPAQRLLRERLAAWREYTRVCPAVRDGGVLERYLVALLEGEPQQ